MRSFNSGASQLTPLGQLLAPRKNKIQPQLGLGPPRPDSSLVGQRQNLPGQIPYGSLHPSPIGSNAFTGAKVANPMQGLVQGTPPSPTAPSPGGNVHGAIAPALAALGLLTGTPHGGAATPPVPPAPQSGPTGANVPGSPGGPPITPSGVTKNPPHPDFGTTPGTVVTSDPNAVMNPYTLGTGSAAGTSPLAQALAALLANSGVKQNPSIGSQHYYQ